MIRLVSLAAMMCLSLGLSVVPAFSGEAAAPDVEKQKARIAELVRQLGDKDFNVREEATKALAELGDAPESALEEASKSKDAEIANRAGELLKKIKATPKRKPIDPNCTDGYQMIYGNTQVIQTFKAPAEKLDSIRFRLARTWVVPQGDLVVELRDPAKPEEPLATVTLYTDWRDWTDKPEGAKSCKANRYFKWMALDTSKVKLEKDKSYELVFHSAKAEDIAPWLVNCFYRDTYSDGELRVTRDGKAVAGELKCDLAFELVAGEAKTASAPKGADLSKKDEHYGIGPDGMDRRGKPESTDSLPKEAFL